MSKMFVRAAALMSLLTLLLAGPAAAMDATKETGTGADKCLDAAYNMYNECLTASDSYWHKVLCDVAFQINALTCSRT